MKTLKFFALLLPALSLACGSRAVDLEGERVPKVTASNDPAVVAVVDDQVTSLAVDDERLYWVGIWVEPNVPFFAALRSCKKTSCADSLLTYDPGQVAVSTGFFLQGGEVFWLQAQDFHHSTLHACSVAGCDHGSRVVSSFVLTDAEVMTPGADAAFVSVTSFEGVGITASGIYRFSLGPGDNAPTVVARPNNDLVSLAEHDDYLYWLEVPSLGSVDTPDYFSGQMLQRTLADGSGSPQLLANHLLLGGLNTQLAVDQNYAYWSESVLYGSISRCPLTGCADPSTPEVFVQPIRSPTTLWLDAGSLYWAHDTAAAGYAMSACRLSSCTPVAAVAAGLADSKAMAFDDAFIYAAATAQETITSDGLNVNLPLRRFPKVVP